MPGHHVAHRLQQLCRVQLHEAMPLRAPGAQTPSLPAFPLHRLVLRLPRPSATELRPPHSPPTAVWVPRSASSAAAAASPPAPTGPPGPRAAPRAAGSAAGRPAAARSSPTPAAAEPPLATLKGTAAAHQWPATSPPRPAPHRPAGATPRSPAGSRTLRPFASCKRPLKARPAVAAPWRAGANRGDGSAAARFHHLSRRLQGGSSVRMQYTV